MRLAVRPAVVTLEDRSTPATFFVDPSLTPVNTTFNAGQPNQQTVTVSGPSQNGFTSLFQALQAAAATTEADVITLSNPTATNPTHLLTNALSPGDPIVVSTGGGVGITSGVGTGFTAPKAVVTPTDDTTDDLTAVLQASGTTLNLSNLTLNGDGNNIDVGRYIQYVNASGAVDNVTFVDIVFVSPPNNNPGIALTLQNGAVVTVTNSVFTNFGNAGISVRDSQLTVQTSQFVGGGTLADPLQYGIQAINTNATGSTVTVNSSSFTNFTGTDSGDSSAAIFLPTRTGVSPTANIFGNTFAGNQIGVLVGRADGTPIDSDNVNIFANSFTNGIEPAITGSQSSNGAVQAANNFFGGAAPSVDAPNGISANVDTDGTFLQTAPPTNVVAATPADYTLQTGIAANGIRVTPPSPLPAGNIGLAYSQRITATGGTGSGTFTFSLANGSVLPAGLTLNPNGTISGTPRGPAGTFNFVVRATDSLGQTADVAYAMTVGAPLPITISPATLPVGTVSTPYTATVSATGGLAPFTFAVTAGSLPAGLTLNAATGVISGTPVLGNLTSTFTVTATDALGASASRAYSVGVVSGQKPLPNQYAVGQDVGGGTVNVYDKNSALVGTTQPFGAGYTAGVRVAEADVTGDGIIDLIVATGPGVPVGIQVIDGNGGAVIATLNPFEIGFLGGAFVTAGDITGDNIAEIVVTPDQTGGPRVVVYRLSGTNTFTEFASFIGITDDPNFRGGVRAGIADVNADGIGDIIVAAGFGGGPRVAVFNGATVGTGSAPAKLFNDFFAFAPDLRDGTFVSGGDINADGYADIITAAGPGGAPRVQVVSGYMALVAGGVDLMGNSQNLVLANFFAGNPDNRQGARVAAKNLDGDLFADIVTGDGQSVGGRTNTYLGSTLVTGVTTPNTTFEAFPGFSGGVFVG
jgi:hypothetical protein